MPWDGTELWVGELTEEGEIGQKQHIADGPTESIFQPEWSPDGVLHFISDRSGWWNLYRWYDGQIEAPCPMEAEFARPQWVFGMSTYAFVSATELVCSYSSQGTWRLAKLDTTTRQLTPLDMPYTEIWDVRATPTHLVFGGGSPPSLRPSSVWIWRHSSVPAASREHTLPRRRYFSAPQAIEFYGAWAYCARAVLPAYESRFYCARQGMSATLSESLVDPRRQHKQP
jgi:hypothetical protein